jgi:putative copper export protein
MLLIKLGLFAAVGVVATYNAFRVRRRLGAESGTRHIRRTAIIEIVIAAMVIWQTTALVTTPVPTELVP